MWSPKYAPIILTVTHDFVKDYSIKARTFTSHGCKLLLLDSGEKEMFQGEYTYIMCDPKFHSQMASEIAETFNVLLELEGKPERVNSNELEPLMLEVLNKCVSAQGKELEYYPYEALVLFK